MLFDVNRRTQRARASTAPETPAGRSRSPATRGCDALFRTIGDVIGHRRAVAPVAAGHQQPAAAVTRDRVLERLGLLLLAVFVVVMHHVVGAHAHGDIGASAAAMAPHASSAAMSSATHGESSGSSSASVTADAGSLHAAEVEPGAALGSPDSATDAMVMLHLCLAVLAAVIALAALVLVAVALDGRTMMQTGPAEWLPHSPRPPPAQRRQARLQVLRL